MQNMSAWMQALGGFAIGVIAGFAVRGGRVRTVLRGMGPSLAAAGRAWAQRGGAAGLPCNPDRGAGDSADADQAVTDSPAPRSGLGRSTCDRRAAAGRRQTASESYMKPAADAQLSSKTRLWRY